MANPEIKIVVSAEVAAVNKALTALSRDIDSWSRQAMGGVSNLAESLAMLTVRFTAMTAPVLAAGAAIYGVVTSAADYGDQLNKTSQKIGISVEALSGLQYAAKLADVDTETLTAGIAKLSKAMFEAQDPAGEAAMVFKSLGVDIKDANGSLRSTEDVLLDLADRFSGMEDGAGKTALAMAVFGKSAIELIPLLNAGSQGIKDMTDEAREAGLVITTEAAQAAEKFNDNITQLTGKIKGLVYTIGNALIPALNDLFDIFSGRKTNWEKLDAIENRIAYLKKMIEDHKGSKGNGYDPAASNMAAGGGWDEAAQKEIEALAKQRDALRLELTHLEAEKGTKSAAPALPCEGDKKFEEYMQRLDEEERKLYLDIRMNKIISGGKSLRTIAYEEQVKNVEAYDEAVRKAAQDEAAFWREMEKSPSPAEHERVRALLKKEAEEWLEIYGAFSQGFKKGLDDWVVSVKRDFAYGVAMAQATAQGMQEAFSDFFFDAMEGKLKSLGDYFKTFIRSIEKAIADMLSQKIVREFLSYFGSYLMPSSQYTSAIGPTQSGAAMGDTYSNVPVRHAGGLVMHRGGLVPRFHLGGLSSDEIPAVLQKGEYVVSRRGVAMLDRINSGNPAGNTVNVAVNVTNQTGAPVDAKAGSARFDGEKYVVDVVLKNIDGYGALRHAIKGVK